MIVFRTLAIITIKSYLLKKTKKGQGFNFFCPPFFSSDFPLTLQCAKVVNNNNNKSFIYTEDIYQYFTMLVFKRCPVNKIYNNNITLNHISEKLKTAKIRLLKGLLI